MTEQAGFIMPWPRTPAQRLALRTMALWASYVLDYKVVAVAPDTFIIVENSAYSP